MAGIEHRQVSTILQAFDHFDKPNWAIFVGNEPRDYYVSGDKSDGRQRLSDYLDILAFAPINQTYTLRVYGESQTAEPDQRTKFSQSTTFNLFGSATKDNPGGSLTVYNQPPAQNNTSLTARLDKLEEQNRQLAEERHKMELRLLEQRFTHQIAGLTEKKEAPDPWERFFVFLQEKPEILNKALDKIGDIVGYVFKGKQDFINHTAPAPGYNQVQGTNATEPDMNDTVKEVDQDIPTTAEGALINPFLTAEQQHLKQSAKYPIVKKALEALHDLDLQNEHTEDYQNQLDNIQMICVEILEKRTSKVAFTQLLLTVACLDDEDLNKTLNYLA